MKIEFIIKIHQPWLGLNLQIRDFDTPVIVDLTSLLKRKDYSEVKLKIRIEHKSTSLLCLGYVKKGEFHQVTNIITESDKETAEDVNYESMFEYLLF